MAVTLGDGTFLWANKAFESLLQYSLPELTRKDGVKWVDLTTNHKDLETDQELIKELLEESRDQYHLQKAYRKKTGDVVDVIIQVIRYPSKGTVECFLVTIMPVEKANEYMASRIRIIEKLLSDFIKDRKSPSEKLIEWAQANKIPATILGLFISFLLFGPRVIEFAREVKNLFFNQ